VRVFSPDASRFGLWTGRRRRLTACGIQPVGTIHHVFEGFDVDGAGAPTTGERFLLERPALPADRCHLFRDAFAQAVPESLHILPVENSGAHTAPRLRGPGTGRSVPWPPDGPELTPSERVWRELTDEVAWEPCAELAAQLDEIRRLLQAYDAATLHSLAGYAYVVEAIHALRT